MCLNKLYLEKQEGYKKTNILVVFYVVCSM